KVRNRTFGAPTANVVNAGLCGMLYCGDGCLVKNCGLAEPTIFRTSHLLSRVKVVQGTCGSVTAEGIEVFGVVGFVVRTGGLQELGGLFPVSVTLWFGSAVGA